MNPHTARRIYTVWAAEQTRGGLTPKIRASRVILKRNRPHTYAPRVPETFRGPEWGRRG